MIYYIASLFLLYALSYGLGLLVVRGKMIVHDSRKIQSIVFFLCATALMVYYDRSTGWTDAILTTIYPLIWVISFLEPIRNRIPFLKICFASIDRPEDRPFTIILISTGFVVGYWVLLAIMQWLSLYNAAHLIFITVFISTFGDGLAEPIGIRFGKHKYKTRALFTKKSYVRSIEGSACVALSAVAGTVAMYNEFTPLQLCAMLVLMPICMAVTEAKSPHTWDNPFLHLVGGLITILCLQL
jgi:dolichol kinase